MNIAKLFRELLRVADIEVVIPLLPEVFCVADQSPRNALFQRLERIGEGSRLWFTSHQVDVLRHHDITIDEKAETASDALQRSFKRLLACVRREQRAAMIATERNEMALSGFLKSLQTPRHEVSLRFLTTPLKPKEGLNGAPSLLPSEVSCCFPKGTMSHLCWKPK